MESANLHHHQLEEVQLVGSSSPPPLPIISTGTYNSYGAAGSTGSHAWSTPNLILNTSLIPNLNGATSFNPREASQGSDDFAPDHISMTQNLGFPWINNAGGGKIKQELSISSADSNFPNFTEMLINSDNSLNVDLSEKLLLKTISASSFQFNAQNQLHLYSNPNFGRSGSFSQIYPSINVPNLSQSNSSSSSLDMNLQALDLLTSERFNVSFDQQPSCHDHQMYKDSFVASSGFDNHLHQMHESLHDMSSCNQVQRTATESKRGSSDVTEPSHTPKKTRLDSCPPLKVRKEKLGDRIAALQQLVAPFGKTDTASVLMEAIGYIQFLQSQVKTLSVPYMKSSRNKSCRAMQGGSNEEGNEETRRDLRNRGLCLVPLSCMSYVASIDSGGCEGVWPPPPNFGAGGATLR